MRREIERYFSSPSEPDILDPVGWWIARRQEFPLLSQVILTTVLVHSSNVNRYCLQFAIDLFTVCALSVSSEQVNSRAKRFLPDDRHRLSANSVEASVCLQAWQRYFEGSEDE